MLSSGFWSSDLQSQQQKLEMIKRLFVYYWVFRVLHVCNLDGPILCFLLVFRSENGSFWWAKSIMSQCLEGVKHLCASLLRCCDLELQKQSQGLDDPAILASETVCMQLVFNITLRIFAYVDWLMVKDVCFSMNHCCHNLMHLLLILLQIFDGGFCVMQLV